MGKLGKKARKFAKKNLQSVLKRKRKLNNSVFKKRSSKPRGKKSGEEEEKQGGDPRLELSNGRDMEVDGCDISSLYAVFGGDDDTDASGDESESDGYLSEDADDESCKLACESPRNCDMEEKDGGLSAENRELLSQVEKNNKKIESLKEKDPGFIKFLEGNKKHLETLIVDENYSDDETIGRSLDETDAKMSGISFLRLGSIELLCELVKEQNNVCALVKLTNAYRAACHYDTKNHRDVEEDGRALPKILMFMLAEADNIFQKMLGVPSSIEKKNLSQLKNSLGWKIIQPLIKSYLRSSLYLLNEVTDPEILVFALARLRDSVAYFTLFPSLLKRLIKISVHLWLTGVGTTSQHSFLIMRDIASKFTSNWFDLCLVKAYKSFVGHCQFIEPALLKHVQFLKNSFVELCTQDIQKSFLKAFASVQLLAKMLRLAIKTKKKEAVKKICSWQYANCIDIWVTFVSINITESDFQPLIYMLIQVINGVATLFPGPRYLPLRVKCVQWLNHLSSSSGVFIPIASLALDILEYKIGKDGKKPGKEFSFSSSIKLPKHWLKSRNFQEECVSSAIELLVMHFAHWSYHISFPELATIPIIQMRKFQEMTTTESLRRVVKRFIDQVEQNIEFVQKRRGEVAFSPKDQQSVDSFLQLEKCNSSAPFTQYYRSILEKSSSRNILLDEKKRSMEQSTSTRPKRKLPRTSINVGVQGQAVSKKVRYGEGRKRLLEKKGNQSPSALGVLHRLRE